MRTLTLPLLCLLMTFAGCSSNEVATPSSAQTPPPPDDVAELTPFQRRTAAASRAPRSQYDLPGDFDDRYLPWATDTSEHASEFLLEEYRRAQDIEVQAAISRALIVQGERAYEEGLHDHAANVGIGLYLSGCPHTVRRRALRLYCMAGPSEGAMHRISDIVDGKLDPWFLVEVPDLLEMVDSPAARSLERELQIVR